MLKLHEIKEERGEFGGEWAHKSVFFSWPVSGGCVPSCNRGLRNPQSWAAIHHIRNPWRCKVSLMQVTIPTLRCLKPCFENWLLRPLKRNGLLSFRRLWWQLSSVCLFSRHVTIDNCITQMYLKFLYGIHTASSSLCTCRKANLRFWIWWWNMKVLSIDKNFEAMNSLLPRANTYLYLYHDVM